MADFDPDNLRLTDFLDLPTLQEIQDSFAAVANVKAVITDAAGGRLTQPAPTSEFLRRQRAIAAAEDSPDRPQREGTEYVAPIMVANQRLGTLRMTASRDGGMPLDEARIQTLSERTGMDAKLLKSLAQQINREINKARNTRPAAIQFMFLLANAIARLCFQEFQLRQRINELTAVYTVTMMLSESRDLGQMLQRTTELVCELMGVKASSIRLIDKESDELVIRGVHNLSAAYLSKGKIHLSKAEIDKVALSSKGFEYVRNMGTDPRVLFPQESVEEGIVSMLSVGMRYKGRPVGALRVYTSEEQTFTQLQVDILKAVAAQAAAAIENARLLAETAEAEALEKQVIMAREVQQRMMPHTPPTAAGVEFACAYVPCFELGGDFYDFIPLPGDNIGLAVADVSGKGVPASLIMASVRSSLRAHVDLIYYLYEVLQRLNTMLHRDTKTGEFVTLFYGVLDMHSRRFTYCNAGHPAALLLRAGKLIELGSENLILGVDPAERYVQKVIDLLPEDILLIYTDGLPDAMNFQQQSYGRQRLVDAFLQGGETAEAVVQNVLWDMRKFVGLTKRTDDVTMIGVKVK
jgi:serine phosphatase RsbU (regulator of sigma subunit)/ligand-binding sensor protein